MYDQILYGFDSDKDDEDSPTIHNPTFYFIQW